MNVLLLTADSLRPDRTSLFGHVRDTTPFLSTLADDAYEFRLAYANGHNTAASFPSVHCSTYQSVFEGIGIPESGHPTLAEVLGDHASLGITTNELLSREYNYDRGFEAYVDSRSGDDGGSTSLRAVARDLIGDGPLFEVAKRLHFFSTETFGVKLFDTADAVSGFEDRIVDWATARDDWFAWAHYMNPHHPYEPPEELQRELGMDPVPTREATKLSRKMRRHPGRVTDDERETLRDLYDAEVLSFDREVESLLDRLDAAGELEDTLVVVTADHGELLGEDGRYGHPPLLRQGIIRVPLLFHGPVPPGGEERQVPLLDLAPTIATLAGRDPPDAFEGASLFDADGTPRTPADEPIVAETAGEESLVCCVHGDEKVVHDVDEGAWTGYRIANDGFDETPVDGDLANLRSALSAHLAWSERHRTAGAEIDQDRLEEDLEALGYLE